MTVLLLIALVLCAAAIAFLTHLLFAAKQEMLEKDAEIQSLRTQSERDVKYFDRTTAEHRSEMYAKVQFIRELDTHHQEVEDELSAELVRQKKRYDDLIESLESNFFLMPAYRPSYISAA